MGRGFGDYVADFFRNLRRSDDPAGRKAWLTVRNRTRSIVTLKGCCGHRGEPGC